MSNLSCFIAKFAGGDRRLPILTLRPAVASCSLLPQLA